MGGGDVPSPTRATPNGPAADAFDEGVRFVYPDRADAQSVDPEIPPRPGGHGEGHDGFCRAPIRRSSPLAKRLFAIEGVERVFFGTDFVTVTKAADQDWQVLKPSILGGIMEHYTSGDPWSPTERRCAGAAAAEDDEIVAQIKELLDTRVRPAVAQDGGDIVFQDFRDGVVYLHMQGSCSGCPSSTATLKMGIENLLKHYVPEVVEVQAAQ